MGCGKTGPKTLGGTLNIYWWGCAAPHPKRGGLRHGHNQKGGLRHGHESKKGGGVLGTGTNRKRRVKRQ